MSIEKNPTMHNKHPAFHTHSGPKFGDCISLSLGGFQGMYFVRSCQFLPKKIAAVKKVI